MLAYLCVVMVIGAGVGFYDISIWFHDMWASAGHG